MAESCRGEVMKYGDVAEELRLIRMAALAFSPWLSLFFGKLRVVGVEDMPCEGAVDERGVLLINVKFWRNASKQKKVFIVLHETLHVALKHFIRARRILESEGVLNLRLFNIACDCVVNGVLGEELPHLREVFSGDYVNPYIVSKMVNVSMYDVGSMSCEEIYHLLLERIRQESDIPLIIGGVSPTYDLNFRYGYSDEDIIQDGSPEIYSPELSWEDVERRISAALRSALVACRCTGRGEGRIDVLLGSALRPRVDWRAELRESLRQGVGCTATSTWRKPNRKLPGLAPGVTRFKRPDVFCVVDVSGSVGQKEIDQFFAEVFAAARLARVFAVFFDNGVRCACEVKPGVVPRVKGGGGTVISPALELVYGKARYGDVVVVLSDGFVADEDEQEEWLRRLSSRVSKVVYCSTARLPKAAVKKVLVEVH
ncbi:MAG: VWA domain-containing protein [Candidatus Freyarchaeota archaeon]|nr:VWA domain-containing protein [Candidatus Jordarchaeia archaeon]